jgi:hypothetical protein
MGGDAVASDGDDNRPLLFANTRLAWGTRKHLTHWGKYGYLASSRLNRLNFMVKPAVVNSSAVGLQCPRNEQLLDNGMTFRPILFVDD